MPYLMNVGGKRTVTYKEWVSKNMGADERAELMDALAPYAGMNSDGTVSLEKFKKDFSNLSAADRKDFMKTMQDAINFAHAAMNDQEFDVALQNDLDRRNKEAYGAGWEKSVANAKARAEQAKAEVFNDN